MLFVLFSFRFVFQRCHFIVNFIHTWARFYRSIFIARLHSVLMMLAGDLMKTNKNLSLLGVQWILNGSTSSIRRDFDKNKTFIIFSLVQVSDLSRFIEIKPRKRRVVPPWHFIDSRYVAFFRFPLTLRLHCWRLETFTFSSSLFA